MAKKKARSCSKKSCGKKCKKELPCEQKVEFPKEPEVKSGSKADYFLGLIKKAFGYGTDT